MRSNRFKKTLIRLDEDAIKPAQPAIEYVPLDADARIAPPEIAADLTWLALVVRPGTHRRVMAAMRRAGITVYCPVETLWSRRPRSNVRQEMQRPLLGSILFVGTHEGTAWSAIRFNDDVTGVLSNAGKPLPIPVPDLRALAARERASEFSAAQFDLPAPEAEAAEPEDAEPAGIQLGDVAALGEGPFVGQEVDVVGLHGDEARVVLKHFASATVMRIPMAMLREIPRTEVAAQ